MTPDKHAEPRHAVFGWALPDLAPDEYLADVWHALGEARDGSPLEWSEMRAYVMMTGVALSYEECGIVADMSRAYCAEARDKSPFTRSPLERLENV